RIFSLTSSSQGVELRFRNEDELPSLGAGGAALAYRTRLTDFGSKHSLNSRFAATAQPLIPVLAGLPLGTGDDFGSEVNLEVVEGIRTVGGCLPTDVRASRPEQLNLIGLLAGHKRLPGTIAVIHQMLSGQTVFACQRRMDRFNDFAIGLGRK